MTSFFTTGICFGCPVFPVVGVVIHLILSFLSIFLLAFSSYSELVEHLGIVVQRFLCFSE